MGEIDRAAIRARTKAATDGPWMLDPERADEAGYEPPRVWADCGVDPWGEANADYVLTFGVTGEDAEFIAHARTDIPALLAALEDAERERDRAIEARNGWASRMMEFAAMQQERDALAAVIEQVRERLEKPLHPYGDKSLPMFTERASLRDLYGEEFIDDLDAILEPVPQDRHEKGGNDE